MSRLISECKLQLLNVVAIFFLCIPLGTAFFIEFFLQEMPCLLCFLQRLCFLGIGVSLFFNVVDRVQVKYYGFALLWALLGLMISLRHISVFICSPVQEGDFLFFSLRVPVWSFIAFFLSILGFVPFLVFHKEYPVPSGEKRTCLSYIAASLLLLMSGIGFFSVFKRFGFLLASF